MKINTLILLMLLVIGSLCGCAGTHDFGPYSGRVVDKDTNEPIEGAVVFIQFFTKRGTLGGDVPHYADAVEVLTDSKGEFTIPVQKLSNFQIGRWWDKDGHAMVFKPGYGCFPQNRATEADPPTFPDESYAIIKLPKLKTKEERLRNTMDTDYSINDVPYEKQRLILDLINQENISLGLQPIHPVNKPRRN